MHLSLISIGGNGILAIDYHEIENAKNDLKRAKDINEEVSRRIKSAKLKLQADNDSSRIRVAEDNLDNYYRNIGKMQTSINNMINKLDRVERRVKEVDKACAAKINAIGAEKKEEKKEEKKKGLFDEVISFWEDTINKVGGLLEEGRKAYVNFTDTFNEELSNIRKEQEIKNKIDNGIVTGESIDRNIIGGATNFLGGFIGGILSIAAHPVKSLGSITVQINLLENKSYSDEEMQPFMNMMGDYSETYTMLKMRYKNPLENAWDNFKKADINTKILEGTEFGLNAAALVESIFGGWIGESANAAKAGSSAEVCDELNSSWNLSNDTKIAGDIEQVENDSKDIDKLGKLADEGASKAAEGIVDSGLTQSKIDEILSIAKGKRPDPSTYLSQEYIRMHLAQFDDGASIIMTKEQYINYVKGNPYIGIPDDETQFVIPKSVCDKIAIEANGNITYYEKSLGFDIGHFEDGGGLVRIDINDVSDLNLRVPSGNEAGANSHWVPGGFTDGGIPEAISDLIPNVDSKVSIIELK